MQETQSMELINILGNKEFLPSLDGQTYLAEPHPGDQLHDQASLSQVEYGYLGLPQYYQTRRVYGRII